MVQSTHLHHFSKDEDIIEIYFLYDILGLGRCGCIMKWGHIMKCFSLSCVSPV